MKIIINADDFGIDIDRDFGIFYGVIKGYISSVSVVVTNYIGLLRKLMIKLMRKKASIGIHINLTDQPLLDYKLEDIFLKKYDYSKSKHSFWHNAIDNSIYINNIEKEIRSQIDRFFCNYNFFPEHMDGHNHCNIFNSKIARLFEKVALENKIHLRIPYENLDFFDKTIINSNIFFEEYFKFKENEINDELIKANFDYFFKYDMYLNNYMCNKNCKKDNLFFIGTMYGYFKNTELLLNQLTQFNKNDTIQIMTHPGFYWKRIYHKTKFSNKDRRKELKVLKDLYKKLRRTSIEYVNYKEGVDYIGK